MFFKKYKIKKTSSKSKVIPYTLWTIGVFLVGILWVKAVDTVSMLEFNFLSFTQTSSISTLLKNAKADPIDETPEKLNILLIGRGGGNHDAPDLTDTLILASINAKQDSISLLSIPRDLYVNYPTGKNTGKINQIYQTYKYLWEPQAIGKLQEKITDITGQEIDYYVNVDFDGFEKIIDILGGVEVTLEENFVDNSYPTENFGYTTFMLKKWTWTLDGETALKYARSRYSTSDFDRSLRQQEILSSLKNKVMSLGYFKDNKKIRELYWAIQENIETDIDVATLIKLAVAFKTQWEQQLISFNLNDSCFAWSPVCEKWGFLYTPDRNLFGWQSVLLVEESNISSLSNYDVLETYMSLIFDFPEIYTQPVPINIYNTTKVPLLATTFSNVLKKYWFFLPEEGALGNIKEKNFEKSILYYNGIDKNNTTLVLLEKYLWFEVEETELPLYSGESVRIEIILGDDFEEIEYLKERENLEIN